MATSTVENYLKQLYLEQAASGDKMVPMGRLASAMGVVPGTATTMVKALADTGMVTYLPRTGVRLTSKGQQAALNVLRRQRVIELFLVKTLGLDWSEVHHEADQLEHAVSDRVLERIDALLGHPTVDPHGDPIPTAKGHVHEPVRRSLADCEINQPHRITRIIDQDREFLRFVERAGMMPGSSVTVESREGASDSVRVKLVKGKSLPLGTGAANKILVEPVEPG